MPDPTRSTPPRALLFDIDGTLIDSNDLHVDAWDEVFRAEGHDFPRAAIHAQIGKGGDNLVPTLLPDASAREQQRVAKAHGPLFKKSYIDRARPFPGARDLLARAHREGMKVVLASCASQDEVDHYLDLLDARDLVDATTSADDAKRSKPDPDIFAIALEKVAPLRAIDALVIGDTPYDVAAAMKCGTACVALRSGGFDAQLLREAGALALYRDAADLLAQWDKSPLAG